MIILLTVTDGPSIILDASRMECESLPRAGDALELTGLLKGKGNATHDSAIVETVVWRHVGGSLVIHVGALLEGSHGSKRLEILERDQWIRD